jgi:ABC-type glycerol-3-phosphate transport system substrate-binding protein
VSVERAARVGASYAGAGDPATTLVYWTNLGGADGSTMKALAEQYARETPLVTVEQIQGVAPYFDKVLAAVAAGTPPDVLGTRMPYVPFLAEQGVIADLTAREIQQLGLRPEDFEPNVWKSGEWKRKLLHPHGSQRLHAALQRVGGARPGR